MYCLALGCHLYSKIAVKVDSCCKGDVSFCSPDAGVLEHRCPFSKDTLLGPRDGWLAPPAGHPAAKMVPPGDGTGSNERIGPCHVNS